MNVKDNLIVGGSLRPVPFVPTGWIHMHQRASSVFTLESASLFCGCDCVRLWPGLPTNLIAFGRTTGPQGRSGRNQMEQAQIFPVSTLVDLCIVTQSLHSSLAQSRHFEHASRWRRFTSLQMSQNGNDDGLCRMTIWRYPVARKSKIKHVISAKRNTWL